MYMFNMIIKFDMFNEGLRDKMTPKSEENIWNSIKDLDPTPMLIQSAGHGYMNGVKTAIERGADIDFDRGAALMQASDSGSLEMVKYIVEKGVDTSERKSAFLMPACIGGYIDIVEYFISIGLLKDISYQRFYELLDMARHNNHKDIVGLLIKHYQSGEEPNKHKDFIEMIIKNESLKDKMTPISKEKLNDVVLHKINKNKELGYFNPLDWGLTLLDYDGSGGLNDHHIVEFKSQDNRRWEMTLDERSSYPIMIREMKRGISYRVAFNYKEVEDYLRKRGLEKIVNEGVRDKMTPKSKEDIIPIIIDKILYNYTEKSVCFTNNSLSEPRIIYNQNTNIMNKVSSMFGNGIYVIVLNPTYYTNLKEFFWKKNIAFSQVMSDTYRIYSHDKIKIVLAKLVEDVYNNKTDNFIIQKFTNWMR